MKGYVRQYYLLHGSDRRLARWEQLEKAIVSVCSDRDRNGEYTVDKAFVKQAISLLEDTFL